jgi:hypothetical protein
MMAVLHHAEDAATLVDRQLAIAAQEGIEYVVE